MTTKTSRKVVIIDRIKSDVIEQAIFILRTNAPNETRIEKNSSIVLQAQEIIDKYVDRVYQTGEASVRPGSRAARKRKRRKVVFSLAALTIAVLAAFLAGRMVSFLL